MATTLNQLVEVAGGVLARGQVRIRSFRPEEGNAGRMLADLIKLMLQQRLLGQYRVFDNQLEQAGYVKTVEIVGFGGGD
ncbi:hypothetical protein D3C79_862790 [compost metagenome]